MTTFEAKVVAAVPKSPRSATTTQVARSLYGAERGYRYIGTVGRALNRLAARELIASRGRFLGPWRGWYRLA